MKLNLLFKVSIWIGVMGFSISSFATTYTVSNISPTITTPNGLHWAIDQANNNPGVDIIEFSIDGTIDMLANTFVITEGVIIDGTTAPGYVAGNPSFILDRNGGVYINTSGSPVGIEIIGLGFTNQNANQNGSAALVLNSCTDLTLHNNVFTGISTAMDINFGAEVSILNNEFNTTGYGSNRYTVEINGLTGTDPATRLKMTGNQFTNCGDGLVLTGMDNLAIDATNTATTEVHLAASSFNDVLFTALRIDNSDNLTLDGIDLSHTTAVNGSGLWVNNSNNVTIQNLLINNKSTGIRVENCNAVLIQDNVIDNVLVGNAGRGIWVNGGQDVEILDNAIRGMGRLINQFALDINNVIDDGSGNRLVVNGTTFDGGGNSVTLTNMDALTIDNVVTTTPSQGVHLPDADGRQGMANINMNLFNIDNTTINNFDLSYTGGTVSGQALNTNACDGLTITNNTINNRGRGIDCINNTVLLIQDNVIDNVVVGNSFQGINVNGGQNIEILDNTIREMGRVNNSYALQISNVSDDGSGNRLVVNGTIFDGGIDGVQLQNMNGLSIDNIASTGQGVHLTDADGRQGMPGVNLFLNNMDDVTIDNFDLSYTGGTISGQGLRSVSCDTITVSSVTVSDRSFGMFFQNCTLSNILGNTISGGNGSGIEIFGGNNHLVQNNSVSDFTSANFNAAYKYGSIVDDGMGNRLSALDNSFSNNFRGILVNSMNDLIISDGTVAGSEIVLVDADNYSADIYGLRIDNCTNTQIENLTYRGANNMGAGIDFQNSTTSLTKGVTVTDKNVGITFQRNAGHVVQQSLLQSNTVGINTGAFNVLTNYTFNNNNFSCNTQAIRANIFVVVDAANNFWGQADGSSTDTGSGDAYGVTGNAPNTGIVNNSSTFLTTADATSPVLSPMAGITGNSVAIANGETATSAANHTDFGQTAMGGSFTRTFTITNTGVDSLDLTSLTSDAAEFVVSNTPTLPVAGGETGTFDVEFTPSSIASFTGTITVANDDCYDCLLYTSPSPRDLSTSRMPSSA